MPVLMIWPPKGENAYGHAALQTEKYHMSFWPRNRIEGMAKLKASSPTGVDADLILHHQRDKYLEDNRDPNQYVISTVSDEDLDRIFEEFLRFNGIEPYDVAEVKTRVNRLIRYKWTEQLRPMIEDGKDVDQPLSKTKYSFLPQFMGQKKPGGFWSSLLRGGSSPFAERAQSCTSFCYHLIELADKSKETMTPIPLHSYDIVKGMASVVNPMVLLSSERVLDVPTFEKLAKQHYTKGAKSSDSVDFAGFRTGNTNKNKSKGSK